jgi:hypothetical protein
MIEFEEFPKISRWSRDIVITEKIDGTNACVIITANGEVATQSRTRLITPEDDNYGFAQWVQDNKETLIADLGEGRHFGEWWGKGIGRNYGMSERMFSLFNSVRWGDKKTHFLTPNLTVVPELYHGMMDQNAIDVCLNDLKMFGSKAHNGFMRPEGIVIFHTHSRVMFKKTLEKDSTGKGQ